MSESVPLPDGTGRVEFRRDGAGHIAVVTCLDHDGSVRWQALPPDGEQDSWVSVDVQNDRVVGSSWSCWHVSIASVTGNEIERRFTK